jgi:uncharacterized membrane protein
MNEEERQKLIEKRKEEQKERELQQDIARDLKPAERKRKIKSIRDKYENKYVGAAIIFLGTLIPLYFFVFVSYYLFQIFFGYVLFMIGISIDWMITVFHIAIWAASIYSVYRGKSVLDDLIDRFA